MLDLRILYRVGEYVYGESKRNSVGIAIHEDNISMISDKRLDNSSKHLLYRSYQIETLQQHTIHKVNKTQGNECGIKLNGSKCDKVVSR